MQNNITQWIIQNKNINIHRSKKKMQKKWCYLPQRWENKTLLPDYNFLCDMYMDFN